MSLSIYYFEKATCEVPVCHSSITSGTRAVLSLLKPSLRQLRSLVHRLRFEPPPHARSGRIDKLSRSAEGRLGQGPVGPSADDGRMSEKRQQAAAE